MRRASLDQRWSCQPLTFSCMDLIRSNGYGFFSRFILISISINEHIIMYAIFIFIFIFTIISVRDFTQSKLIRLWLMNLYYYILMSEKETSLHWPWPIILQILHMKANPDPPPCWGGLLIYIYPMVIVFSILVQCFITAWRVDHRNRARTRRRHMHHRQSSRPRETREEARQRKYRYLYQVRTARGDIISQVSYYFIKKQLTFCVYVITKI